MSSARCRGGRRANSRRRACRGAEVVAAAAGLPSVAAPRTAVSGVRDVEWVRQMQPSQTVDTYVRYCAPVILRRVARAAALLSAFALVIAVGSPPVRATSVAVPTCSGCDVESVDESGR